ncbi:hypothetical protein [Candidatus Chloroploca asiatica]|uniref:Uncharacterized protein n=1 Tax=Candidatus Chloroploca asiatica TaxID=1506545 RepID=A0A2H3KVP7_9CHLR|nr:hypothetical protein [Candidatus Chloroploca asiatica]PDV97961.1 hypothetical protein A9Q02_16605 [Candidatus Chloroploca asiatica]
MNPSLELKQQTQEFLRDTVPGEQDLDAKVRHLIEAEYMRQLGHYRRVDLTLTHKYGMTFNDFLEQSIPRQKEYSWEVEQDAMDWETAMGGMATVERKLRALRETTRE